MRVIVAFLAFILHCDGCTQYPIHIGPVEGVSVASLPVCLQRLKISIRDLHSVLEGRLGWWVLISGLVDVSVFFPQPCTTSTPPRLHLSTSSPVHLRNSTRPTNALSQVLSGLTLTALQVCGGSPNYRRTFW